MRTDVFLNPQYSGISALISSAADVYNHPAGLGEDFHFIHNALASNPLPKGWLPLGKEYWPSGGSLEIITWGIGPSAPP